MIKYLILEEVEEIHREMLERYGGLPGIRDENLLCSAIEHPKMSIGGQELYPSIYEKAAAYLYHIARNHPFNDANKRTAAAVAIIFLKANHIWIAFEKSDFEKIVLEVAQGLTGKEELTYFLEFGKKPDQ